VLFQGVGEPPLETPGELGAVRDRVPPGHVSRTAPAFPGSRHATLLWITVSLVALVDS
jgi:hypothetical protein